MLENATGAGSSPSGTIHGMTKKKTRRIPTPYRSPLVPQTGRCVPYLSADLKEVEMKEHSELSHAMARKIEITYEDYCGQASVIPTPLGWGILHCTVWDKRGRRRRVTLATDDLTYHRAFVAAASYENRTEDIELAVARYPFMRAGWPGPARQRGSWPSDGPIPWRAAYRDACPEMKLGNHLHGLQVTATGITRSIRAEFAEGLSGAKWTTLDDDPFTEYSKVFISEFGTEFYVPPGVAVMPGWPFLEIPRMCIFLDCS
ncbi:hypothetical protein ACIRRI_41835 [Streptomyces mirabilis]|uniref:hypothetical protein n=1 Tax=Streptomyces mirabilis TaxID=68239 RepID=UPI00382A6A9B